MPVHTGEQPGRLQCELECLQVGADLVDVLVASGVVINRDVDRPAVRSARSLVEADRLRGMLSDASRPLLPIRSLRPPELVHRRGSQPVGGEVLGLADRDRLTLHPFRAGAGLGDVPDRAHVPGGLDGCAGRDAR